MEITNASIEDIDRIEEIATAAFKSTVYYAKPILTTHVEHFPQGFLLARAGKEVERKARRVQILDISVEKIELPRVWMTVSCSKGT